MKPSERLKEIEFELERQHGDPIHPSEVEWLIARVHKLEEALKSIASLHRDGADEPSFWLKLTHKQCADTNAKDTEIARKALESE